MSDHVIRTIEDLYERYKQPSERVKQKQLDRLDVHCRNFIAHAPFLVLGTNGGDGTADASPRGDAPGFVRVVDDTTLLLPDRPGNNRLDSLQNIVRNPAVGLLFMIPGFKETLRVNGNAEITTDPALLAENAVGGKLPLSIIRINVTAAYLHCGKALIRSHLWDPASFIDSKSLPTAGKMFADQMGGLDADELDAYLKEGYKTTLY